MKYEVGDVIKIKEDLLSLVDNEGCINGCYVSTGMLDYQGITTSIVNVRENDKYKILIDSAYWFWDSEMFEPVKLSFKPDKFETGMFGEMNDGDRFVVVNDILVFKDGSYQPIADFDNNLTSGHYKVMKVKTGCDSFMQYNDSKKGTVVYERQRPKKLTHNEIENILGFDFEMVY